MKKKTKEKLQKEIVKLFDIYPVIYKQDLLIYIYRMILRELKCKDVTKRVNELIYSLLKSGEIYFYDKFVLGRVRKTVGEDDEPKGNDRLLLFFQSDFIKRIKDCDVLWVKPLEENEYERLLALTREHVFSITTLNLEDLESALKILTNTARMRYNRVTDSKTLEILKSVQKFTNIYLVDSLEEYEEKENEIKKIKALIEEDTYIAIFIPISSYDYEFKYIKIK